jgi:hypothetical protein
LLSIRCRSGSATAHRLYGTTRHYKARHIAGRLAGVFDAQGIDRYHHGGDGAYSGRCSGAGLLPRPACSGALPAAGRAQSGALRSAAAAAGSAPGAAGSAARPDQRERPASRARPRFARRAPAGRGAAGPGRRGGSASGTRGVATRAERQQSRETPRSAEREAFRNRIRETRQASERSAEGLSEHYQRQAARNQARSEERLRERRRDLREDRRDYRQDVREARRWDRAWRNDTRYDWQRYRYSNRNLYRAGRYYAPYRNHSYSRLSIGLFLGSGFYGDNYWINDPWQYRLPAAYPGTRWVRYYDDVLLIDVYTGEVIDVIYDFFW